MSSKIKNYKKKSDKNIKMKQIENIKNTKMPNRVMKKFRKKVKHHTKKKVCNPHDYKYKWEEVFKAEDLEHIGFKSSQMENNMKFLYLELNTYIRENIKKKLKIEDSTIGNIYFKMHVLLYLKQQKQLKMYLTIATLNLKEFRKQDKDLVCDNNSIDPVKLIMYISKQNGKEKTKLYIKHVMHGLE